MEQTLLGKIGILLKRPKNIFAPALFALIWVAALSLGLAALLNYSSTTGRVGIVSQTWPVDSKVRLATSGNTIVMLAHPRCPCTRASINELAQIMAHARERTRAYVLFLKPKNSDADWDDTDLRRNAAKIPGVTVLADLDGVEARRFGAETSGHTLLFDSTGRLLFSGGITESRGHAGDNLGEKTIVSLVNNQSAARGSTSVFGCALVDRTSETSKASRPR